MTRILIADDDPDIVAALKIYLSSESYEIAEAYNGAEALNQLKETPVDLVLMDIMMPEIDGIEATVKIRETSNIPIILLTAKSEDADKVLGLNIGADDYITKPFNPAEVVARVNSQLRRYQRLGGAQADTQALTIGGITLNDEEKTVTVDGSYVELTPIEFSILKFLMEHAGTVYSSKELYEAVWQEPPYGSEGVVAVHMRHLREKVEINPSEPRYLKVVWGRGYKMEKAK